MKILVLGAGRMGYGAAWDLIHSDSVESVTVADMDAAKVDELQKRLCSPKIRTEVLDVSKRAELARLMRGHSAAISCVVYRLNLMLAEVAIETGVHFCDLGGNNTVVDAELALDARAKEAGITIIPDCGLAPGMVSILVADAASRLDTLDSIRIRVGGLPQHPKPPLNYQIVFSVEGLINEYIEPVRAIRNGEIAEVEPMAEIEELEFEGLGRLEAFNTSGGTSTLPETFKGRVRELNYKTIRYPGHAERFKLLMDLGLTSSEEVDLGGVKVAPRRLLSHCLLANLPQDGPDLVLVRVMVEGVKDGQKQRHSYEIIDRYDEVNGLSAMMRTTAFPASIIAQMMARGEVSARGAVPQELAVPSAAFIAELEKRNIPIKRDSCSM